MQLLRPENREASQFRLQSEVRMQEIEHAIQAALQACLEGRFTDELRVLYQSPSRERVPWHLFPNWARPVDPVEGGHEGGNI